jgi:hypothetical protein
MYFQCNICELYLLYSKLNLNNFRTPGLTFVQEFQLNEVQIPAALAGSGATCSIFYRMYYVFK